MQPSQASHPTDSFYRNQSQTFTQRLVVMTRRSCQKIRADRKKFDETFPQFGLWKYRPEQATNDRSDEYGQHHAKLRPEYRWNCNLLLTIQTHRSNDRN